MIVGRGGGKCRKVLGLGERGNANLLESLTVVLPEGSGNNARG